MNCKKQDYQEKRKIIRNKPQTLCWRCENAVPTEDGSRGCSWSRDFKPVDGWIAQPTIYPDRTEQGIETMMRSYHVLYCPCCIPDKKANEHGARKLRFGCEKK